MPGFDRTGPLGFGPRTGRGLGPCGQGYGRICPRRFYGYTVPLPRPMTKEEEKKILEENKKFFEEQIKEIEKRLKELEQ